MSCNFPLETFFWDPMELPTITGAPIQDAIFTNLGSHDLTEYEG
jgi:hypothetical protein